MPCTVGRTLHLLAYRHAPLCGLTVPIPILRGGFRSDATQPVGGTRWQGCRACPPSTALLCSGTLSSCIYPLSSHCTSPGSLMQSVWESRNSLEGVSLLPPRHVDVQDLGHHPHEAVAYPRTRTCRAKRHPRGKLLFLPLVTCSLTNFLSLSSGQVIALYGGPEPIQPLLQGSL